MSHYAEVIGYIAGILAISGYVPYIYSILQGKTRPERSTWFIWTLIGGLLAFSYIAEGDANTIWLPLGYFFGPLITALLSIKYGYASWSKLDTACVTIALISIIPWLLLQNATYTLIINLLIDTTGALPTLLKTYREPETEDFTAWLIFFIANTLQIVAITYWNLAALYPIYLFLLAGAMVAFILRGKIMPQRQA